MKFEENLEFKKKITKYLTPFYRLFIPSIRSLSNLEASVMSKWCLLLHSID